MSDDEDPRQDFRHQVFAIADRVVVKTTTTYEGMDGYYGRVVAIPYREPVFEPVFVELHGRTNGEPMREDIAHNNPWPFFNKELEHSD